MSDWEDEPTGRSFGGESNDFSTDNADNGFAFDDGGRKFNSARGGRGRGGRGRGNRGGSRGGYNSRNGSEKDGENGENGENGDVNRGFGGRGRGRGRGGGSRGFGSNGFNGGNSNDENGSNDNEENGEEKKPREYYIPPAPTEDESEMFNSGISSGINFSKYDKIPIKLSGENVPPSISTFDQAGFRDILLSNVKKSGYTVPTPIQKAAIPIIAAGRDLMGCAQTGSGKTAAFLLPIIDSILNQQLEASIGKPIALVVSPTRELSIQIFNEARKFSHDTIIKTSIVYGGTSSRHQSENISRSYHILIATPGRLLDFVDKGFISFEDTRFVVLDEADRMLDMGFTESVSKIMSHPTMRPIKERQTLMFSATFPEQIQHMAAQYLNNYIFATVGVVGGACSDVQQNFYEVKKFEKRSKLMEILAEASDGTIVFVQTKRGADFLASVLSETEYPTTSIHGDRLQRQREEALSEFKSGRMKVLIATAVAARGLDIKNVKHVVNYDLPTSIDEYVHRIGRTGRVGNKGKATSFFDPEADSGLAGDLVNILEGADQDVPSFLRNFRSSGGGDDAYGNDFGATDVRGGKPTFTHNANGPDAHEEEEDWS